MSIKRLINSELNDLNLDLIIEGLNEIISDGINNNINKGSFTTVLSEDGDVVCNIVNDELNADNCTLEENEDNENVISENVYKVYHGTNNKFSKFNFKTATQGIVWFTDSIDSIKQGEHGGAGNSIIMTRYITINKPAGWEEYEKYGLQQLQDRGYDGVILPQENKTDYFVFSPKSISAKDNSNTQSNLSEEVLNEGLSDILYHYTYTSSLLSILKYNKFATSSNLGSNADSWKDKGRFYFFSTQRTKGMSGYARHHGNVAIVLDGRKLNYTFKGYATDYWNWSKKRSDYKSIGDYTQALQSEENEDRIVTNKPYIDNANKYIIEIHISVSENEDKNRLIEIDTLCKNLNIPLFFYLDDNSFKLQDKRKTIPLANISLEPKEKSAYDEKEGERDLYNAKWFFKKIAPSIIANNNMNDGYNDEKDQIEKLLKQLLEQGNQPDQFDNVMTDINDKVKRMTTSSGYGYIYGDDEFLSMQAEIHNHRGDPNPYLRELLKMLITDMKKWGVKNLKEYFNKKFQAGIKENMSENLNEVKGEFTTVYHGTSVKGAENIQKYGIKMSKSSGGYFGWGFYTATEFNLAKSNYADFAEEKGSADKGAVLEFRVSPEANILDLRKDEDFKIWQPYSKAIYEPNLYQVLVKHGIDGLYDNSFEGVVIYNAKVLTLIKVHYL